MRWTDNSGESTGNREDRMEEKMNELEDRSWEMMQAEKETEPRCFLMENILREIAPLGRATGKRMKKGVVSLFHETTEFV